MAYRLLADFILVIHVVFIAFVIFGLILIVIGAFRHWQWIRNSWFRVSHLAAIGIVVAESWLDQICPLTGWESRLREAAGGVGYSESFIEYWLHQIVFYDFSPWAFITAYTVFGLFVVLAWIFVPPRFSRR